MPFLLASGNFACLLASATLVASGLDFSRLGTPPSSAQIFSSSRNTGVRTTCIRTSWSLSSFLNMIPSRTQATTAFTTAVTLTRPSVSSRLRCSRRRARTASMTLQPQDSSWQEERDRRAIESEFLVTVRVTGEVDNDMAMLRERMQLLGRKEKQWADICQQFISLSILTGIPLIDPENGEPTIRAWLFLSLSAAIPLYILCLGAQWLHSTSLSFSHLL